MFNTMSNRMQRFLTFHPAFLAVLVLLLLVLVLGVLGVLGQWSLLFMLIGMTILFSINMLIFSTMYQMYRNAGSDDYHHPFSCMLYSLVDPRPSRAEQERIERQAEDFKPFVFKNHPKASGHA